MLSSRVVLTRQLNISYPHFRSQKLVEFDDERKVRVFYDKRISDEVAGDSLGEEFKGYIFKITGGFDKQGFAMKQGVATNGRVRLLLDGCTSSSTRFAASIMLAHLPTSSRSCSECPFLFYSDNSHLIYLRARDLSDPQNVVDFSVSILPTGALTHPSHWPLLPQA